MDMTGVSRVRLRTVTGFKRMGKWVFRLAKNHVKVTREKHPEMARTNEDFGSSRKFFARLNNAMGDLLAWKIAAAKYGGGMTGDNFMFHVNYDKLEGGAVACFRLFRFSVGTLWLPWNLAVTRGKGTVTITWRDNRHSAHCSPRDELLVGVLYEKFPKRPMVVGETGAVRSTGTYTLELDSRFGTEVHVYPFFMNPGRTEFSDSEHLW